jgi:NAD(P)-dependent dehydrogenase (short-subunit alcohol dehydrogenase family)
MAEDAFRTPYEIYRRATYPALDPTQSALSTKGKSAVVSGASSGIGAQVALSLAKSGISYLALLGRREDRLKETASAVKAISSSTQVFYYPVDVLDATALNVALSSFASQCSTGKVDILVANAGYMAHLNTIADADPADWWLSFEINIKGNFNLVRAFFSHAAEGASIIHVSSNVIHGPYLPGYSSYRASKAGAHKLFAYLSEERPDLFVLQIHPGFIDTEIFNKMGISGDIKATLPFDNSEYGPLKTLAVNLTVTDYLILLLVELPGDFVVWVLSPEGRFLNGRFVWANWDVDELKADEKAILADPKRFTINLKGWA